MNKLPHKRLTKIRSLTIGMCLLACVSNIFATEQQDLNWYTVEVIAFTRDKSSQLQEQWISYSPQALMELPALPADDQAQINLTRIEPVSENEWQLSPHAYSLSRSQQIKIQSHQAWRQPGFSRDDAPWVDLQSDAQEMTGKVRISLSRYLHADIDITFPNPDWTPYYAGSTEAAGPHLQKNIIFKTSRRLKRNELHYLDHPLAGVIIKIERFEKPDEPADNPVQENQTSGQNDSVSDT